MIHFTCDMCGKEMPEDCKDRHIVQIDVRPANSSWELTEADIEEDNLAKISQMLKAEESEISDFGDARPETMRLDLCSVCRESFLEDPLRRQATAKYNFSKN
jgi:hypothetical protein